MLQALNFQINCDNKCKSTFTRGPRGEQKIVNEVIEPVLTELAQIFFENQFVVFRTREGLNIYEPTFSLTIISQ